MPHSPALEALLQHQWAMHPRVFDQLRMVILRHAAGIRLSDAEIAAAIADSDGGTRRRDSMLSDEAAQHLDRNPMQMINGAAIIPVRGVIARYADQVNRSSQPRGRSAESLQADLLAAADHHGVDRIILRIHSPGGAVMGTEETARLVAEVATRKPVIAYVDGMAASAALWIASQADRIVLSGKAAEIGSLGVITATASYGKKSREMVDVEVHRSVDLKAPGAFGEQLSDEQRAAIKAELQAIHNVFADAVQSGRGLSDEQLAAVATGEVFFGQAAIDRGLADDIQPFSTVLADRSLVRRPATVHPTGPGAGTTSHKESTMDKDELMALIEGHEAHATTITRLAKAGADAAVITAVLEAIDATTTRVNDAHSAAIAAKDAEITQLKADLDKANARVADLAKLGKTGTTDPGSDHQAGAPGSVEAVQEAWDNDPDLQASFALGGITSYVEHLRLEGELSAAQARTITAALQAQAQA